jgi:threonine/homoserine efflux transporter RhtA
MGRSDRAAAADQDRAGGMRGIGAGSRPDLGGRSGRRGGRRSGRAAGRRSERSPVSIVLLFMGDPPDALLDVDNLPRVIAVGVFGTLLPFLLYIWGIQRVRAERAVIAATLEPVLAASFAWIWLGQSLSGIQLLGGALVVAAVSSLQLEQARRRSV